MSKKTAELSHKQQQRGQDEEECRLRYGIWNTQTLREVVSKPHSVLTARQQVNRILYFVDRASCYDF
jgi:hypothetical protein